MQSILLCVVVNCKFNSTNNTIIILSFRTDRSGKTVQTQSSLIRVCTVCLSICIFWAHHFMVKPPGSNFRVITAKFLGVLIFRFFMVIHVMIRDEHSASCDGLSKYSATMSIVKLLKVRTLENFL